MPLASPHRASVLSAHSLTNPRTTHPGSYGLFFNLGDIADGATATAASVYGAGAIEDLASITATVEAAAAAPPYPPAAPPPVSPPSSPTPFVWDPATAPDTTISWHPRSELVTLLDAIGNGVPGEPFDGDVYYEYRYTDRSWFMLSVEPCCAEYSSIDRNGNVFYNVSFEFYQEAVWGTTSDIAHNFRSGDHNSTDDLVAALYASYPSSFAASPPVSPPPSPPLPAEQCVNATLVLTDTSEEALRAGQLSSSVSSIAQQLVQIAISTRQECEYDLSRVRP